MKKTSGRNRTARLLGAGLLGAAAAGLAYYSTAVEPYAWRLRRIDVPVLGPDSEPFRVLHVSDLHMLSRQNRKQEWLRGLAALDPDLVALTGDNVAAEDAVSSVLEGLSPLRERPGAFVLGNSDYYGPTPKVPWNYTSWGKSDRLGEIMPTAQLSAALKSLGWHELTNQRVTIDAGGRRVELSGVDDASLGHDDYDSVAGNVDASAQLHIGLTHTPDSGLVSRFAADGFGLVLAGHTHGGQVRLPGYGAIVTNCDLDRRQACGLHNWGKGTFLHVSAGIGTSPYLPVRFGCPPEATMLTLVPNPQLR